MYFSLILQFLTFALSSIITESYILVPYYTYSNRNFINPRNDDNYMPSESTPLLYKQPVIDYYGTYGPKHVFSLYMPLNDDKSVADLLPLESTNGESVSMIGRRSDSKQSKAFNKAFGHQFSQMFADFGTSFGAGFKDFGQEFGGNFGSDFKKIGKNFGDKSKSKGSGFLAGGSNIGKKFKSFFKQF